MQNTETFSEMLVTEQERAWIEERRRAGGRGRMRRITDSVGESVDSPVWIISVVSSTGIEMQQFCLSSTAERLGDADAPLPDEPTFGVYLDAANGAGPELYWPLDTDDAVIVADIAARAAGARAMRGLEQLLG